MDVQSLGELEIFHEVNAALGTVNNSWYVLIVSSLFSMNIHSVYDGEKNQLHLLRPPGKSR